MDAEQVGAPFEGAIPMEYTLVQTQEHIVLREDGDLFLVVGTANPRIFRVKSDRLSAASTIFDHFIQNEWLEMYNKRPNGHGWVVQLPYDDPDPFYLLLGIMHCPPEQVPKLLTITQLFDVCVVAHKYQIVNTLSPFARDWLQPLNPQQGDEHMLYIAWVLGDARRFKSIATQVAKTACLDPMTGRLITAYSHDENQASKARYHHIVSSGILGGIAGARLVFLDQIVKPLRDLYTKLCSALSSGVPLQHKTCGFIRDEQGYRFAPVPVMEVKNCISSLLGNFNSSAITQGIFSPQVMFASGIVKTGISASYNTVKIQAFAVAHEARSNVGGPNHVYCTARHHLLTDLNAVDPTYVLTPEEDFHLMGQGVMSGLREDL